MAMMVFREKETGLGVLIPIRSIQFVKDREDGSVVLYAIGDGLNKVWVDETVIQISIRLAELRHIDDKDEL